MSLSRQIGAVTAMNIRSIPDRLGASLVVVVSMMCVVAVFVSMLSMSTGFMESVNNTGRPDRAMVLTLGSTNEGSGGLPRDAAVTVMDAPGVVRDPAGKAIGSAEAISFIPVKKRETGLDVFVMLRGVGPQAPALRPVEKLTEGRMFKPAVHELIVGKSAVSQFKGLNIGDKVPLPEGDWTVVGTFESNDDMHQSELRTDAETLLSAYRRNTFNSITVQLTGPDMFDAFKAALTTNPALNVEVQRETEYFAQLAKQPNALLSLIAYWVGGIMAVGAVFGALNTMYAAVSSRSVEIATLRAIGFGAGGVVVSVFAEALLLAVIGAVFGGAIGWFAFNGNQHGFGGLVIKLAVTPGMLAGGIVMAILVGTVGALFPAIRAARLPVATALQVR